MNHLTHVPGPGTDGGPPTGPATDEVLGVCPLGGREQSLGAGPDLLWITEAELTFLRPEARRVPVTELPAPVQAAPDVDGWDYWRLHLPFGLAADPGRGFTQVLVHLALEGADVESVLLDPAHAVGPDTGTGAPAAATRLTTDRSWAGSASLHWSLRDADGGLVPLGRYEVAALVRVPAGTAGLRGALSGRAVVRRKILGVFRGRSVHPPQRLWFDLPLGPSPTTRGAARPRGGLPTGTLVEKDAWVRRVCLAVDVEGYSRRPVRRQASAQERLVDVMREACLAADVDLGDEDVQHQGDGQFRVLAAGIDEPRAVVTFLRAIRAELLRCNDELVPASRLRLRIALDQGLVRTAAAGYAGDTPIAVARLLDSVVLRERLRSGPDAVAAVALSDEVYRPVAGLYPAELEPYVFVRTEVVDEAKGFRAPTWIGALH